MGRNRGEEKPEKILLTLTEGTTELIDKLKIIYRYSSRSEVIEEIVRKATFNKDFSEDILKETNALKELEVRKEIIQNRLKELKAQQRDFECKEQMKEEESDRFLEICKQNIDKVFLEGQITEPDGAFRDLDKVNLMNYIQSLSSRFKVSLRKLMTYIAMAHNYYFD